MSFDVTNIVFAMLFFFGFMAVMKNRGSRFHTRDLQRQVAELQMAKAATPAALPGASQEQVKRLEERVRVLERTVTDNGTALSAEIEALREPRESERSF